MVLPVSKIPGGAYWWALCTSTKPPWLLADRKAFWVPKESLAWLLEAYLGNLLCMLGMNQRSPSECLTCRSQTDGEPYGRRKKTTSNNKTVEHVSFSMISQENIGKKNKKTCITILEKN